MAALSSAPADILAEREPRPGRAEPVRGRLSRWTWWDEHPFWVPAMLAVVAAVATWVATRHGPGLSPDSVTYISAARNLVAGHGYSDLTGQPNTTFAPGFSAVLAIGQWAGLSVLTWARVVNAAAFAAVVVLTSMLLRRHVASPGLALAATAFVAVSPTLLNVARHAWSEPLFCAVLLGFILLLEGALASAKHRTRLVALAGFLAGVGFLVRYAALALAIAGVVVLLVPRVHQPARTRLGQLSVFALAFVPLPALWLLRNATSGAPYVLGPRVGVSTSLWNLLGLFASSVRDLVAPSAVISPWAVIALPVVALMVVGALAATRERQRLGHRVGAGSLLPLSVFVGTYSAFVLTAGKVSGASVETRTVMPIYVPLVIIAAWLIENARTLALRRGRHPFFPGRRAGLAIGVAFLLFYGVWFAQNAWSDGTGRGYYNGPTVVDAPLARTVQHLPADALVVSNSPWALYYASGHQPIVAQPGPLVPAASLVPATIQQLLHAACAQPVYVAWYGRPGTEAPTRVFPGLVLHSIHAVHDGTLYKLSARTTCVAGASPPASPRPA